MCNTYKRKSMISQPWDLQNWGESSPVLVLEVLEPLWVFFARKEGSSKTNFLISNGTPSWSFTSSFWMHKCMLIELMNIKEHIYFKAFRVLINLLFLMLILWSNSYRSSMKFILLNQYHIFLVFTYNFNSSNLISSKIASVMSRKQVSNRFSNRETAPALMMLKNGVQTSNIF